MGRWLIKTFSLLLFIAVLFGSTFGLGLSLFYPIVSPLIVPVSEGCIYSPIVSVGERDLLAYQPNLVVRTNLGNVVYSSELDWVRISIFPFRFKDSFRFYLSKVRDFSMSKGLYLRILPGSNVDVAAGLPQFGTAFVKAALFFPDLRTQDGEAVVVDISGQVDAWLKANIRLSFKKVVHSRSGFAFRDLEVILVLPKGKITIRSGEVELIPGIWFPFSCTNGVCRVKGFTDSRLGLEDVAFSLDGLNLVELGGEVIVKVADGLVLKGRLQMSGGAVLADDLSGTYSSDGIRIRAENGNLDLASREGSVALDVNFTGDFGRVRLVGEVPIKGGSLEGKLGPVAVRGGMVFWHGHKGRMILEMIKDGEVGSVPVELKRYFEIADSGLEAKETKLRFLTPLLGIDEGGLWVGKEYVKDWQVKVGSLRDWKLSAKGGSWRISGIGEVRIDRLSCFAHDDGLRVMFKGVWSPLRDLFLEVEGDAEVSLYGLISLRLFSDEVELEVDFDRGRPIRASGWVSLVRSDLERLLFNRSYQGEETLQLAVGIKDGQLEFATKDGNWRIVIQDKGVVADSWQRIKEEENREITVFGERIRLRLYRDYFLLRRLAHGTREVKTYGLSWLKGPGWELVSDLPNRFRLDIGFWQAELVKFDWLKESGVLMAWPKGEGVYLLWSIPTEGWRGYMRTEVYRQDASGKWERIGVVNPDIDWIKSKFPAQIDSLNPWERLMLHLEALKTPEIAQRLGIAYLDTGSSPGKMYRYKVEVISQSGKEVFESPVFVSPGLGQEGHVDLYTAKFDGWSLLGWKKGIEGCMPVRVGNVLSIWAGSGQMCVVASRENLGVEFVVKEARGKVVGKLRPSFLVELANARQSRVRVLLDEGKVETNASFVRHGKTVVGKWMSNSADKLLLFERIGKGPWLPIGRFLPKQKVILPYNGKKPSYRLLWLKNTRVVEEKVFKVR